LRFEPVLLVSSSKNKNTQQVSSVYLNPLIKLPSAGGADASGMSGCPRSYIRRSIGTCE
jgi:hypothetical protein